MSVVFAETITKTYRIGIGKGRVREALPSPLDMIVSKSFPRWWMRNTFNAIEDVSLSVPAGSAIGIVGHNGAGKTTLLKMISGVTSPSTGSLVVSGKVAALLDVVVGFHPELTGRENAFLLGAILGVRRKVMAARMSSIFEFAEIGDLADTPLKRYSAGMVARLGFSTITALDVDLLLVDEVLAVGDSNFQRKCIDWLDDYRSRGGTLMFVSHNLSLVRNMTQRVVWVDHGRLVDDGDTSEVLARYAKATQRPDGQPAHLKRRKAVRKAMTARGLHRWGAGGARIEEVELGEPSLNGAGLEVAISYESDELDSAVFCMGFLDEAEREIGAASSPPLGLEAGRGRVRCLIRPIPLRPGIYFPVVAILSPDGLVRDRWRLDRAVVIERENDGLVNGFGPVVITASWHSGGTDIVPPGRMDALNGGAAPGRGLGGMACPPPAESAGAS